MPEKILVTGASGFIASHTIIELLNAGYQVRGTVRDLQRTGQLQSMFERNCQYAANLELAGANLSSPNGWSEAVKGCDGVFHVASPAPVIQPKDENDLIIPAREGTLHVLTAARQHNIRRVVLTSSVSAVSSGARYKDHLYTASDWSNLEDNRLSAYDKSKTLAEKAAWNFVREGGPELVAINPAMVLGPALESDYGSSLEVLVKLMTGQIPLIPPIGFGIVDVRDVARLHRLAYEVPEAAGNRYLCSNGFRWITQIADTLLAQFPDYSNKIPKHEMPRFLVRFFALFFKEIAGFVDDAGKIKNYDNAPALALGWRPFSPEKAILAGAESLIKLGIV
jgi:dihydroflavonol-4-reductase